MIKTVLFLCSGNYYRSRYAEIVFNELARASQMGWVAASAGLLPEHFAVNPGPISPTVIRVARERGLFVPEPARAPRAVTAHDLATANRIIALKESEHRPILVAHFPEWADRVVYWNIHDVDVAPPSETLPLIERAVAALVEELKTPSPPAPLRDR